MATTDPVHFDGNAAEELASILRGELVRSGDVNYEQHRKVWNGSIDRFPALIARCTGAADVIAAVRFARAHGLLVAVRGGGHSFPGYSVCDGGMVIDLSLMKAVRVDPVDRTVRAQAGVLLGELDHETQAFGLVVPAGFVSHTGLAGLTLGGGIGFTMRRFGLTIDNLLSVDLITADGELIRANEGENADLFWGVRGGGGNFGIVTEFEFRLHPLGPQVVAGPVFWPIDDAPNVLRFYRDWIADSPDDLMTLVIARRAPAIEGMPADLVGERVLAVVCCYAGSVEEGEKVVRPLKGFSSPVLDLCEPRPFVEHQQMYDASFESGWHYYFRSCDVAELNDDVIDIMVEHGRRIESPISSVGLWQLGGAVARVGEDGTAFNGRAAGHTFNINGNSQTAEGFDEEREWARGLWTALEPYHTSVYVNFMMDEGQERVRQAYGPAKYQRLTALKRQYDSDNFFRLNQNIPPG
ncbi:MAG TPA: FAD-binding oxidoreductase [Actinomycetota bacterium]|nr:FAD-binding oxidoreductase [Actinomycetota bacterium]